MHRSPTSSVAVSCGHMSIEPSELTPTEAAVERTLRGWCAELDTGRKFWWGDWTGIIRDVFVAMRTGEAVRYDDD